jgi:hypothetical protein
MQTGDDVGKYCVGDLVSLAAVADEESYLLANG